MNVLMTWWLTNASTASLHRRLTIASTASLHRRLTNASTVSLHRRLTNASTAYLHQRLTKLGYFLFQVSYLQEFSVSLKTQLSGNVVDLSYQDDNLLRIFLLYIGLPCNVSSVV